MQKVHSDARTRDCGSAECAGRRETERREEKRRGEARRADSQRRLPYPEAPFVTPVLSSATGLVLPSRAHSRRLAVVQEDTRLPCLSRDALHSTRRRGRDDARPRAQEHRRPDGRTGGRDETTGGRGRRGGEKRSRNVKARPRRRGRARHSARTYARNDERSPPRRFPYPIHAPRVVLATHSLCAFFFPPTPPARFGSVAFGHASRLPPTLCPCRRLPGVRRVQMVQVTRADLPLAASPPGGGVEVKFFGTLSLSFSLLAPGRGSGAFPSVRPPGLARSSD